jgi:SpoVK/Ycf46/Vps4 family AAA+-type ATPase
VPKSQSKIDMVRVLMAYHGSKNKSDDILDIQQLLDGVKQIEDVVYIATTNYPEKLQDRITNRPSRFDRRYKVELPNEDIREAYIRHKLKDEDLKGVDVKEWVKRTDGMSLSHLKEVVISTIVMGKEFEEVMDNLEGLKRAPSIKGTGKMGFGK